MDVNSERQRQGAQSANESKARGKKAKVVSTKTKRDNAIQGTNDSSIVSKRSVERTGYAIKSVEHQFFRHFVKKPVRRAPLINLGYFIRMRAIEQAVDKFLEVPTHRKKYVINLGCGYDPLPFMYLSSACDDAVFVDVDYPDLIRHKSTMIRETPALAEVVGPDFGEIGGEVRSGRYYAVGCDLSDLSLFDKVLRSIDPEITDANILFVSEVAITYMPTAAADALIAFTSQLPYATFAILEQIMPAGPSHPFAKTMQAHFEKLTTPLQSLPHYPTLRSQGRRFLEAGYLEIEACDLNTFFHCVMDSESRMTALKKELFDEYEELGAFLGHYFILIARNQNSLTMLCPRHHQRWQYINWKKDMLLNGHMKDIAQCHWSESATANLTLSTLKDIKPLQRRFLATAPLRDGYFIQGGLSNTTRLSSAMQLSPPSSSAVLTSSPTFPPARMCHTLTPLKRRRVLLVGGRDAPQSALSDVWSFDGQWQRQDDIPGGGVYRHAAVSIERNKVLVFGGRRNGGRVSSEWYLFDPREGWRELVSTGSPALWGASLSWRKEEGLLFGGVDEKGVCSGDVYSLEIDETGSFIDFIQWDLSRQERLLTRRYGGKSIYLNDKLVLCIGGAGSHSIIPWAEQFLILDTSVQSVHVVEVPTRVPGEHWLIGHDIAQREEGGEIVIIGGGGVCFSFGSFWNDEILRVSHGNSATSPTEGWKLICETPAPQVDIPASIPDDFGTNFKRLRIETPEDWHRVLKSTRVTVLEGLDFGSCLTTWTPEYLTEAVGSERPVIIHSTDAEAMNFLSKNFKYATRPFGSFITAVFSDGDEKVYLRAVSEDAKSKPARLEDDFPGLAKDFILPSVLLGENGIEAERIHSTVLRVGGVGTSMWLHYDVMANILTQIIGEKELLVFHPSIVTDLDIPPGASSSRIPDIFSSPLRHRGYSTILKPGDAVYIPPLWPHATKPLTPNVGVNVFWKSFKDEVYDRGKDVYGNKDLYGYGEGRKLVERIKKGFRDVDCDSREFYLKRLAKELEEFANC